MRRTEQPDRRKALEKFPNLVKKAKHAIGFTVSEIGDKRKFKVIGIEYDRNKLFGEEDKPEWITEVRLVFEPSHENKYRHSGPFKFGWWEYNPPRLIQRLEKSLRNKKENKS